MRRRGSISSHETLRHTHDRKHIDTHVAPAAALVGSL
jgi:hypothetical protein